MKQNTISAALLADKKHMDELALHSIHSTKLTPFKIAPLLLFLASLPTTPAWSYECDCSLVPTPKTGTAGTGGAAAGGEGSTTETEKKTEDTTKTEITSGAAPNTKKETTSKKTEKTTTKTTTSTATAPAAVNAEPTPAPTPTPTPSPTAKPIKPRPVGRNEVQEQVTLYYFSDVQGLMQLLNPDVRTENDVVNALQNAQQTRDSLLANRGTLVTAQSLVNTRQMALQKLLDSQKRAPQEQAAALARWKEAEKTVQGLDRVFQKRSAELEAATENLETAKSAVTEANTDLKTANADTSAEKAKLVKAAKAALKEAQDAQKVADKAKGVATERRDDAQRELCFAMWSRDDTKANYEKLRTAAENLPAEIGTATANLSTAQLEVEAAKATTATAMLAESAAFAENRNNPVRLKAIGDPKAVQPNLRVDLMAYKDARTIFISGPRSDVQIVKDMIGKFDRPAPQARLSLLTLQLSSKSGGRSAEHMNEGAFLVEEHLANTRARLALVQELLRDAINEEVNNQALGTGQGLMYAITPDPAYLRRITFYHPEVVRRLGLTDDSRAPFDELSHVILRELDQLNSASPNTKNSATNLKAARDRFNLSTNKLLTLGSIDNALSRIEGLLNQAHPKKEDAIAQLKSLNQSLLADGVSLVRGTPQDGYRVAFLKANLPDPAGTTTLGEALMVLSLAKRDTVARVLDNFDTKLDAAMLPALPPDPLQKAGKSSYPRLSQLEVQRTSRFPQLRSVLGAPLSRGTALSGIGDGATPAQREITLALQRVAIARVANLINHDVGQLEEIAGNQKFLGTAAPLVIDEDWPSSQLVNDLPDSGQKEFRKKILKGAGDAHQEEARQIILELLPVADWLRSEHNIPLVGKDVLNETKVLEMLKNSPGILASTQTGGMIQRLQSTLTQLAAPDITNARIAAADEMLKRIIIAAEDDMDRNFVRPMFEDLQKQVRNRGVSVGVIQRTQVLATNRLIARTDPHGTSQMAIGRETDALEGLNAIGQIAKDTVASPTGLASGFAGALQVGQSIEDVASNLPPEKRPEYYGIETGGEFRILPIIDPSGQALRFRFDYVLNTPVHEPNGTINQQLPILTQTTNTEVQLSNLEIRSIAAFDATVQLAITSRRTGGIPLLNDIPGVRSLPVIGWFRYTRGRGAQRQKTILVGQTTIYPTIGDITNLLTPLGPRRLPDVPEFKSPLQRAEEAALQAEMLQVEQNSGAEAGKSEGQLAIISAASAVVEARRAYEEVKEMARQANEEKNAATNELTAIDKKPGVTDQEKSWARQKKVATEMNARQKDFDKKAAEAAFKRAEAALTALKTPIPAPPKPNEPAKADVKADAKSGVKPDVKTDVKTDVKPDAKADAKTDVKPDAKPDAAATALNKLSPAPKPRK